MSYLSCLLLGLLAMTACSSTAAPTMAPKPSIVSATLLGAKTRYQLATEFGLPLVQFGVKYYRVTYTTIDVQGAPDTASALLALPDGREKIYPRLVYQHGTASTPQDIPSVSVLNGGEGSFALVFAGLGYVMLAPDYLGLGASSGFHPYLHAASETSAAVDLLRASEDFLRQQKVATNDQLFITGFSQGGHAAMALHREIETNLRAEFTVTAAAPMAGPYSIGGVMRELLMSGQAYAHPAYLPYVTLSYQTAYGQLFDQLTDVFKPEYALLIERFRQGQLTLRQLNEALANALTAEVGASKPVHLLQPAVLQALKSDPQHPLNRALRANDVYDWAPRAPTRLLYCSADEQVPAANSLQARDAMLAKGAKDVRAIDVRSSAGHGGCAFPALTQALLFFAGFQEIGELEKATPERTD